MSASGSIGNGKKQFWLQFTDRRRLHCSEPVHIGRALISQALEASHEAGESEDEDKWVCPLPRSRN